MITPVQREGWEIVRLSNPVMEADVLPGKGGDILALRAQGIDLLWQTPWGLRARGSLSTATDSVERFLEAYPGGWQTLFPNGGDPCEVNGVEMPFHGEACLSPWEWEVIDDDPVFPAIRLQTALARSPFTLERTVRLCVDGLEVSETVHHHGVSPAEVMWSHHPAFGAPFLSGDCVIETAAQTFVVDDADLPGSDLASGTAGAWPQARARDGSTVRLDTMPAEGAHVNRFGYLTDFERGWARVTNRALGLAVELEWSTDVFPYAWFWLEANATPGYPWYGRAYVLAIEPASTYPGHGIVVAGERNGTLLRFEPNQSRTGTIALRASVPTRRSLEAPSLSSRQ